MKNNGNIFGNTPKPPKNEKEDSNKNISIFGKNINKNDIFQLQNKNNTEIKKGHNINDNNLKLDDNLISKNNRSSKRRTNSLYNSVNENIEPYTGQLANQESDNNIQNNNDNDNNNNINIIINNMNNDINEFNLNKNFDNISNNNIINNNINKNDIKNEILNTNIINNNKINIGDNINQINNGNGNISSNKIEKYNNDEMNNNIDNKNIIKDKNLQNDININLNDNQNNLKKSNYKDDFSSSLKRNIELEDQKDKNKDKKKISFSKSIIMFNESKDYHRNKTQEKLIKTKYSEESMKKKKLENELSREQVKDHFRCYICYNQIKRPRMCKYCKKLACEECLKGWLATKDKCAFCRNKMKFDDTISIPILDDMSGFFLNEVEKEPINSESINFSLNDKNLNDSKVEINKENICSEHYNAFEYFCANCNKKYCAKCLSIIGEARKIHENHAIIELNAMNNNDIKESINEFNKFKATKNSLENLIKLCNLKIKEMEIEKSQFRNSLDSIKKDINDQLNNKLLKLQKENNSLKSSQYEIIRAIETTPNALDNIVKSRDHGQGEKIYEHIKNLNKNFPNQNQVKIKTRNYHLESFESEQFEFLLPQNGNYVENLQIYNRALNDFIPENECQVILKYHRNNICFIISIKNSKTKYNQDNIKYYGFTIIQNKKYDCEFINLEDKTNYDRHILNIEFNYKHFISLKDDNNKIKFKLYITRSRENKI